MHENWCDLELTKRNLTGEVLKRVVSGAQCTYKLKIEGECMYLTHLTFSS